MGTFTQSITLLAASGGQTETLDALVDTGATFTGVPSAVLERLGVEPHRTVRLRLANGQIEERSLGRVRAELNGESEEIICVFGDPDAPPVIGAVTLETFLLSVDPVEQRLVPVLGYWLQGLAVRWDTGSAKGRSPGACPKLAVGPGV